MKSRHLKSFVGMGQQFVEIAMGNLQGDAAVVQGWESQTAQAQASRGYDEPVYENRWTETDYGGFNQQVQVGTRHVGGINDPLAGYTTEQRARAQGQWLGSNPGDATPGNAGGNHAASTQSARPIVLDLDGNGISVTTKAQGGSVLVDVDDDGFAEETDWINPRDGILVIDKNGDGRISGGAEMFSDASCQGGERFRVGLTSEAQTDLPCRPIAMGPASSSPCYARLHLQPTFAQGMAHTCPQVTSTTDFEDMDLSSRGWSCWVEACMVVNDADWRMLA